MKEIKYFKFNESVVVEEWLDSLDFSIRTRISARILRVANNNYGDFKKLQDGIFELRFFFGAGYRIYFGEDENSIIVLLIAGNKSTQNKDILKAKKYWRLYNDNKK